jgi:hypothetical protein
MILDKQKLEEIKKFAEDFGFKSYIGESEDIAYFVVALPSADITVFCETVECRAGNTEMKRASVSIGWSSCDGGQCSTAQTEDFIKYMGYALVIAKKLKGEA